MFVPFKPVFLQILPFLSQEKVNPPHLVISSRHLLFIEGNTYGTVSLWRFKSRRFERSLNTF